MTTTDTPEALPAVAGQLRCDHDGGLLPLVAVDIGAEIRGLVATTTVRQTFRNTRSSGIEAIYLFPLPDRAGVTALRADVAGRRIEGELRERGEARDAYDAAIADGHRAAITEEDRPGTFAVRVGNLQPGEEAVIELTLTGPLAVDDGTAEYRFPLVVAPRYVAGRPLMWSPAGPGVAPDTDAVPDASRVTPPVLLPGLASPVRLTLRARLAGLGLTPETVRSSLHAVSSGAAADGAVEVSLHPGERLDRDVVLRFGVAGAATRTIAQAAPDQENPAEGTWQMTVAPPAAGRDGAFRPRDLVVVLDRSGSMHGWKITAARRAAARIVDSLGPRDRFAVIAFDTVTERPPGLDGLAAASDRGRWAAVAWLAGLEPRGGTELSEPMRAAAALLADPAEDDGRDRFLVLVTDGQVAGEDHILAAVAPAAGRTRIFTLGIDEAVNAGFLRRLAALGAGRCELVESQDRLDEVMAALHRRISPPLVTGLRVEAAGVELLPGETAPAGEPDLFPGGPTTLSGRWRADAPPATVSLTVRGDGGFCERVTAAAAPDRAVRTCWARARVRDLEDQYAAGRATPELADRIVAVSLAHQVLSRFTAFVAVDRSRRTELGPPQPVLQPVELPRGWAGAGFAAAGAAGVRPLSLAGHAAPSAVRPMRRARAARRGMTPASRPGAQPVPLAAYLIRAGDLFDCIARELGEDRDPGPLAAAVDELAADLASVGAPENLGDALRRLADALRGLADPAAALASARRAFATGQEVTHAPAPVAHAGPPAGYAGPSGAGATTRRQWWR
jgi:Ca-activated chloride channel homolog